MRTAERESRTPLKGLTLLGVSMLVLGCGEVGPPSPDGSPANAWGVQPESRRAGLDAGFGTAEEPDGSEQVDTEADVSQPPIDAGAGETASGPSEPAITINAVAPERGPARGGTEILVVGRSFTADVNVYLGGGLCEQVDVVDETVVTCRTPPNPAGRYDLKVANTQSVAVLADAFQYVPEVAVVSVDPAFGPTDGGMPATLTGSGLSPETQVSIGGRLALAVEWLDDSTLRFLTPPGERGAQSVRVSNENGVAVLEEGFEYQTPLRVEAILPGAGRASGGDDVIIRGAGLGEAESLTVRFGLLEVGAEPLEDGSVRVVTPPGPVNSAVDVTVRSADRDQATVPDGFIYFEPTGDLDVRQVAPGWATTDGGTPVVLSGTRLDGVAAVAFGSAEAAILEAGASESGPGYLIVSAPAASEPGQVDIRLTGDDSSLLLDGAFEYRPAIRVTDVVPARGDVAGGRSIGVIGQGFEDVARVRVGALPASALDVLSGTTLTVVAPPGIVGPADVVVEATDGRRGTLPGGFTYTQDVRVHGLSPARGALAGGTWVTLRGAGFVEPVSVDFGAGEAREVQLLDPATLRAVTPPNDLEVYVDVRVASGGAPSVIAPDRFLYFDPLSDAGGVWGEPILGAVNVTVVGERGDPLDGAFVMLDVRDDAQYSGLTDGNGQVTLSGPDLSGPQVVTASRPGFSSAAVYEVDAENVTLLLRCAPDGACLDASACREGFVCQSQMCIDPRCAGSGFGGGVGEVGTITGSLSGMDKIEDPGPDEFFLAAVYVTRPSPSVVFSAQPQRDNVLLEDGPFTVTSRLGTVALVAVCGVFNETTETFRPIRMGLERGLVVHEGDVLAVDLTCDLWLDQAITVKAPGSPLREEGPDVFRHIPFLDLGQDGYFGGLVELEGTSSDLTAEGFAPLTGRLADAHYFVRGGAYTGRGLPYAISFARDVDDVDAVVVLPELVSVGRLIVPESGLPLTQGYLEWTTLDGVAPDFWRVEIRDFRGVTYWEATLPGELTWMNLAAWPTGADVGQFPSGNKLVLLRGVNAIDFDFDAHDFNDFTSANWSAYSLSVSTITTP